MLIVLSVILILLLGLLLWVLLAPLALEIDTAGGKYYLGLRGLAGINLFYNKDNPFVAKARILFFTKEFDTLDQATKMNEKQKRKKEEKTKAKKQEKAKKKKKKSLLDKNIIGMLRLAFRFLNEFRDTFRLKRLYLRLDTGDVILNSRLYPAFCVASGRNVYMSINFQNINEFSILIENRLIKIIFIALKNFILYKNL